jgi:hypothetical protein
MPTSSATTATGLVYSFSCGDPVCGAPHRAPTGVTPCTNEREGDPCSAAGAKCDPGNDCNSLLVCGKPRQGRPNCPISERMHKKDIAYVSQAGRRQLHDDVLRMKLATYKYRAHGTSGRTHLGFLIDDLPADAAAVGDNRERVDLYGYTSMAIAALQEQAAIIARLEAKVRKLEAKASPRKRRARTTAAG